MPPETLRTLAADLIAEARHLDRRIAKAASDIQTARSIDSAPPRRSPPTPAPPQSICRLEMVSTTGFRAQATANSTSVSTSWPLPRFGRRPRAGPITYASESKAKVAKKRCDASNDGYPTSSTDNSATTQTGWRQAREDTRGRLYPPARPAQTPHTDASDKSLPDLSKATHTTEHIPGTLDTERRRHAACQDPSPTTGSQYRSPRCASTTTSADKLEEIRDLADQGLLEARGLRAGHRILIMPSPRRLRDPRLNRSPVSFVLTRYRSGSRK